MQADRPVNLVMQADLFVQRVFSAGHLDAVHAQIRSRETGRLGILGIDLRQRDERSAIAGPARQLGERVDRGRVLHDRPAADELGPHLAERRAILRYRHGFLKPLVGSILSSTRRRTVSSVSRNRKSGSLAACRKDCSPWETASRGRGHKKRPVPAPGRRGAGSRPLRETGRPRSRCARAGRSVRGRGHTRRGFGNPSLPDFPLGFLSPHSNNKELVSVPVALRKHWSHGLSHCEQAIQLSKSPPACFT